MVTLPISLIYEKVHIVVGWERLSVNFGMKEKVLKKSVTSEKNRLMMMTLRTQT